MKAPSRYCANGERCTQYRSLGKPTKLRRESQNSICEACRKAEAEAEFQRINSAPPRGRATKPKPSVLPEREEAGEVLASRAEDEIRVLKGELVISLFKRRGAFWDLIREMRERWDITPETLVPPPFRGPIDLEFPLRTPNPYRPANWPDPHEDRNESWDLTISWATDIREIQNQVVPEKYQDKGAPGELDRFLSACVLYDPPENELLEFAKISAPEPKAFYGHQVPDEVDDSVEFPRMVAPPVKTLRELTESEDWALDCLIYYHSEKLRALMEALGIVPHQLLTEFEKDDPEIRERYLRKVERDESRYFIEVDERMNMDDVHNAFLMIRAVQEERVSGGRPSRDRLTAVQCAVLYKNPNWTYQKVADHLKLGSKDTARRYIEVGQKILKEN
jgi:hypothetical protein